MTEQLSFEDEYDNWWETYDYEPGEDDEEFLEQAFLAALKYKMMTKNDEENDPED